MSARDVVVATGEMQPWSDFESGRPLAGGPVTAALVADLVGEEHRVLVAGPHEIGLVRDVATRGRSVTVLLRSAKDARSLREQLDLDSVEVVAGSLDGFVASGVEPFDIVVAADGLDRLHSTDSPALSWLDRWQLLRQCAGESATVLVGLSSECALTNVLDARPLEQRHGNEDWRPLHTDPTRPMSAAGLRDAVVGAATLGASTWAVFGDPSHPSVALRDDAAAAARPGRLAATLAARAVLQRGLPLLADPRESIDNATQAGLLGALADGWLVVAGPDVPAGPALCAAVLGQPGALRGDLVTADADVDELHWRLTDGAGRVQTIPDTLSVAGQLRSLAEQEDVPAFRGLCARLGEWVGRAVLPEHQALLFDDLYPVSEDRDGDGGGDFVLWDAGDRWSASAEPAEALTAAFWRFEDDLLGQARRHPWPPWLIGDDMVLTWLGMAGFGADPALVARGRALADELVAAEAARGPQVVDVRAALAAVAETEKQLFEARGHIFGLERTIGFRDKQLKVRDDRIRELHGQMLKLERFLNSPVVRLGRRATLIRRPRAFAGAVKRRLRRELKARVR